MTKRDVACQPLIFSEKNRFHTIKPVRRRLIGCGPMIRRFPGWTLRRPRPSFKVPEEFYLERCVMKKTGLFIIAILGAALIMTQCERNPVTADEKDESVSAIEEIEQLSTDILTLHEEDLLNPETENPGRRLLIAIHKLDLLIHRVRFVVIRSRNEEAAAVLDEARSAHQQAAASARAGEWETAFEYVKEGRYLAVEALQLARESLETRREAIIDTLQAKLDELDGLLSEVETLLTEETERASKLYQRALAHRDRAALALADGRLRAAGFHIHEGFWFGRLALRLASQNPEAEDTL